MRAPALALAALCAACGPMHFNSKPNTPPPGSGPVTTAGGAVDRLFFGFTGDTRPSSCNDSAGYPTAIIDGIAGRLAARKAQFALDLGDHMYACSGDLDAARAQIADYKAAMQQFGGTWFMTMGNHECESSICAVGGGDPNFTAFMEVNAEATPWYTFDVQTGLGLARFVVIADNAWGPAEQSWLDSTLADADQHAKYTIVARHHPLGNTQASNMAIQKIIQAHKYALFLTGHSHTYRRDSNDASGRTVILGAGGAPTPAFYGYATVQQQDDGTLALRVYDETDDSLRDSFSVGPNP